MLSLFVWPKVIALSDFYCISKLFFTLNHFVLFCCLVYFIHHFALLTTFQYQYLNNLFLFACLLFFDNNILIRSTKNKSIKPQQIQINFIFEEPAKKLKHTTTATCKNLRLGRLHHRGRGSISPTFYAQLLRT